MSSSDQSNCDALEEGELLLDECRRAGITVWIGKTGSVLRAFRTRHPYLRQQLALKEYAVRLALEHESKLKAT